MLFPVFVAESPDDELRRGALSPSLLDSSGTKARPNFPHLSPSSTVRLYTFAGICIREPPPPLAAIAFSMSPSIWSAPWSVYFALGPRTSVGARFFLVLSRSDFSRLTACPLAGLTFGASPCEVANLRATCVGQSLEVSPLRPHIDPPLLRWLSWGVLSSAGRL